MWYRVLAVPIHGAVTRYFISWAAITFLLGCLPAMLRVRFACLYTVVLVALPVFSQASVSLFAATFVIAAVSVLLHHSRTLTNGSALACLCCFAVSFVRPEYAYGVFIAAVATLICCWVERRLITPPKLWCALGLAFLLSGVMAAVIAQSDSARSGVAFAQHFNLRASQRGVPFTTSTELSPYAYQLFHLPYNSDPGVSDVTVSDFFHANPQLFLQHVLRNALDPFFLLVFAFVLSGTLVTLLQRKRVAWEGAALFVLVVTLPVIASSLIIYPRHHYAVIVLPAALLLNLNVFGEKRFGTQDIPAAPSAFLFALPLLLAYPAFKCLRAHHFPRPRTALADIRCLRSLEFSSPGQNNMMFDPSGIPNVYFDIPRRNISIMQFDNWAGFSRLVAGQHPGWILITPFVAEQYAVPSSQIRGYLVDQGYVEHSCSTPSSMAVFTSPKARPN